MDERGFTLIELLVVILIIGVLAAIALPMFLGQNDRARDGNAKSDVRNAVSQMESCFRAAELYTGCPDGSHPLAPNVVATVVAGGSGYFVSELSDTGTTFAITRVSGGYLRTCDKPGKGGCMANSSW